MSSQGMQDHFGAKSANWQAGMWLPTSFPISLTEPWKEVETSCHGWSADTTRESVLGQADA